MGLFTAFMGFRPVYEHLGKPIITSGALALVGIPGRRLRADWLLLMGAAGAMGGRKYSGERPRQAALVLELGAI